VVKAVKGIGRPPWNNAGGGYRDKNAPLIFSHPGRAGRSGRTQSSRKKQDPGGGHKSGSSRSPNQIRTIKKLINQPAKSSGENLAAPKRAHIRTNKVA